MPGVRFEGAAGKSERAEFCRSRPSGALIGLALSLAAGGCADQVAQYQPPLFINSGAPVATVAANAATADGADANAAAVSEDTAASDWTKRTYVYRGGRDPKTGLARSQL